MRRKILVAIILLVNIILSCKKGDTASDPLPENLTLKADISTDNSGNVSFQANATNGATYEFDFGNGVFQTVASGNVIYKYPETGTYTVTVIAKTSKGKSATKTLSITVSVAQRLVWSDEFDNAGAPNSAKWMYDIGAGGWGNNESQYYTNRPENAVVSNGTLKIYAIKENYSGSAYTSARLLTKTKFSFKYGKVEVSAKLPIGGGTWPAIWMLGNNISTVSWPACGEIDIMEHKGNTPNVIYGTLHFPGNSGGAGPSSNTTISNVSGAFHKYGLEWTATNIKISVDDVVYFTYANTNALPFNQDFFILLNVAMGGNFGGSIDPNFSTSAMEVDYVRVYQ